MSESTSPEPGSREPAPEPLRLIQRFINTNDREGRCDALATPSALAHWLRDVGLRAGRLSGDDLARAVRLREALRALLLANNGQPVDVRALATLNAEVVRTGVVLQISATTPTLAPRGSGLDRALGQMVAVLFGAMVDGTWPRLKACRRDVCQWAFYDHSKNRSGSWCTMAICGNRVKTSAYWRRTHPRTATGSAGAARRTD